MRRRNHDPPTKAAEAEPSACPAEVEASAPGSSPSSAPSADAAAQAARKRAHRAAEAARSAVKAERPSCPLQDAARSAQDPLAIPLCRRCASLRPRRPNPCPFHHRQEREQKERRRT